MRKLPRLNAPVEDSKWTWDRQADQSELFELSSPSATTEYLTCPARKTLAWPLQFLEIWWEQTCGTCARTLNKLYSTTVTKYIKPSIGSWNRIDFRFGPLIAPAWSGAPPGRGIHWFGGVISCDPCDLRGTDFATADVDGCDSREVPKEGRLTEIFLGVTELGNVVRRWWVLDILAVWARRLGVDFGLTSALDGTISSIIESVNLSRVELNNFRANMGQC